MIKYELDEDASSIIEEILKCGIFWQLQKSLTIPSYGFCISKHDKNNIKATPLRLGHVQLAVIRLQDGDLHAVGWCESDPSKSH